MKTKTGLFFSALVLLGLLVVGCPPDRGDQESNLCENLEKDEGEDGIDCGGTSCVPCHDVLLENELLIKHLAVVNSSQAVSGDLSFGKLMERLTPSGTTTKDFILSLLTKWDSPQIVNGITVAARAGVTDAILDRWKVADGVPTSTPNPSWNMNLTNAPFRLLGITNRVDLQDVVDGSAGEGRLTFGLAHGGANDFTLIFEYGLVGNNQLDLVRWAKRWHQLSALNKESPEYLDTLTNIVKTFTATPASLNQIRTNEVIGGFADGSFDWELREFNIIGTEFKEVSRKQSPDQSLDGTSVLADYISAHQQDILSGQHEILTSFTSNNNTANFMAGNTLYNSSFKWKAPGFGVDAPESQKLTAMSCTGCHGGLIAGTEFTHIKPRAQGNSSEISLFLNLDLRGRRDGVGDVLEQDLQPLPDLDLLRIASFIDSTAIASFQNRITDVQDVLENIKGLKRVH